MPSNFWFQNISVSRSLPIINNYVLIKPHNLKGELVLKMAKSDTDGSCKPVCRRKVANTAHNLVAHFYSSMPLWSLPF